MLACRLDTGWTMGWFMPARFYAEDYVDRMSLLSLAGIEQPKRSLALA
jgi:hypothetical protein